MTKPKRTEPETETPAADTPPADAAPIEQPAAGGSYVRQPDGTLERVAQTKER